LAETTWVLASDNNGLPAGNPVMFDGVSTAEKFRKQTSLLKATKSSARAPLSFSGTGIGCTGGETSHDDTAESECTDGPAELDHGRQRLHPRQRSVR